MKQAIKAFLTITVLALCSADAAIVFGNLGADGNNTIRSAGVTNSPQTNPRSLTYFNLAQGFTVSSPGWSINSVKLGLLGTGDIKLSIYSDLGGAPNGELVSQTLSINTTSTTPFPGTTFNFAPLTLNAGSSYWIVASRLTGGTNLFTWTLADAYSSGNPSAAALTQQNASGWSYIGSQYQPTGGGSWSDAALVAGNAQYASLSIDATPIPEPGTWAAMAILAAGAAYVGLRRRKEQLA